MDRQIWVGAMALPLNSHLALGNLIHMNIHLVIYKMRIILPIPQAPVEIKRHIYQGVFKVGAY